jgi:hypothetical protein
MAGFDTMTCSGRVTRTSAIGALFTCLARMAGFVAG